ncbi:heavy metal-associated isoprenylated plant protein 8 isoform X2 [Ricinus communis]|uniref:heavy metal-associated isoprenylated plant protein 8 isoform X2 n=1 Tax=Ricinus communis TaxID=3988 RepID=UPI00201A3632|nr:heavy metal-associated isoprenylated plant protein 8 isoform X2 [Ricinus communis]
MRTKRKNQKNGGRNQGDGGQKVEEKNNSGNREGKNVDPVKVLGRLQKKYSRNVELISPKPKKQKINRKIIELKMYMHCEGCAHDIKRSTGRMEGIMSVEPDMEKSIAVIKGLFDPPN